MKTFEIYANYGVLAAEKRTVYTHGGEAEKAVCSDKITVALPEGWELAENEFSEALLIDPDGETWRPNDILKNGGKDKPVLAIPRGKRYALDVVEA